MKACSSGAHHLAGARPGYTHEIDGPCVSLDLEGPTGELTLEVFWIDASDGSERDVQKVTFTATG